MIDYICGNLWQFWAAVVVGCLIIELLNVSFFIICFSIGAFFAMLSSFFFGIYVQLAVFIVISAISVFLVRPVALRLLRRDGDECRTNADALIGRTGVVCQTIKSRGYGRVAVGGDDWKAEVDTDEEIPIGTKVTVVGRESIIIKVTKSE